MMPPVSRLSQDIELVHRRCWPGRPLSFASRSLLLMRSPGLRLMLSHRMAHWLYLRRQAGGLRAVPARLMSIPLSLAKWVIQLNAKSHVLNDADIEGGVCFSDQGYIIFGARKTGSGTVVSTRVTVGMSVADRRSPEIGRNVWIGPDCVVYGPIRIGDGATLLPGTVLNKTVPSGGVMQGNPARLVMKHFDNSALRERSDTDALALAKSVEEWACSRTFVPTRCAPAVSATP